MSRSLKKLLLCWGLLHLSLALQGAYLKNVPVKAVQPNGEVLSLYASGDEFYHWLHDADGFTIIRDAKTGYLVYAREKNGDLVSSGRIVTRDRALNLTILGSLNIQKFLKQSPAKRKTPQELFPEGSPANIEKIKRAPSTGTLNNIVIFIRFSDESEFTDLVLTYSNMFNNSVPETNSMFNYFKEVSYNQLEVTTSFYPTPSSTVVSYQDLYPRSYYQPYNATTNPNGYKNDSENTSREHTLLKNAVLAVQSQIPSGLVVDGDADGNVDNVCFIVYGGPDGWSDLLWPHQWSLYSQTVYINDKRVYTYNLQLQTSLKSAGVGVLCHEMFHSLGSPDLYHYSYDGLHPVNSWCLMEYNSNPPRHMGAFMKYRYGNWIASIPEITTPGTYSLSPLRSATNNCYKIASPYSSSEYFVIEYRKKIGIFESSLPGEGLLVYRINGSLDGEGNSSGPPDEVYIYRPNGTLTQDGSPNTANFNAGVGRTSINDGTNPSTFLADGLYGGLHIFNVGSVGDTISFTLGFLPVNTSRLDVHSIKAGVGITVSPGDFYGNGDGSTDFRRVYTNGSIVNLTAPATLDSRNFVKWTLDGAHYSTKPAIAVTMNDNHTAVALYGLNLAEALDNSELTWLTSGSGWFGQADVYYYGNDAAQSAPISHNQETVLETTVQGPGDLSFYWKVSSEKNYDFLDFLVDGVPKASISGEVAWQKKTFALAAGVHTLKWRYKKDAATISGSDCGWVDKATYTGNSVVKEDFLGTWDGQGVYYRNSNTAGWVKLATPADLIAAGDLDGDGAKDLIGIWPGLDGIRARYSLTGAWTQVSSSARHAAAGDMNGDGRDDLLGTWDGQGVFYRASISGAWVKMATPAELVAAADLDGDGIDDLIGTWPAQGGVWVKYSKTGAWARIGTTARDISAGDMNGDGRDDLLGTWDGQGVFYLDSLTATWVKMAVPCEQVTAGDLDGDGTADLIGLWTGQGGVWVKYSKTGTWSRISSPAKDIGAGIMREGIWGSPALSQRQAELRAPAGGFAEGPLNLSGHATLMNQGPGSRNFSFLEQKNLVPQEKVRAFGMPGPGQPGFTWVEQDHLVPRKETGRKSANDKKESHKSGIQFREPNLRSHR